jgi:hypothetical protein
MGRIWSLLRIILLLTGGLAAFLLVFAAFSPVAYVLGPAGLVAMVFVMLGAYFLIGRWVLRRL